MSKPNYNKYITEAKGIYAWTGQIITRAEKLEKVVEAAKKVKAHGIGGFDELCETLKELGDE